jgi:glycerol-3-phosphate dehydrogenase (NAD(P)+)
MRKVTVFGAGAWGSTLAQVLTDAGNEVLIWGRNESVVNEINTRHTNSKYLSAHILPS